jgi:nitrite reductase (NO-forming)
MLPLLTSVLCAIALLAPALAPAASAQMPPMGSMPHMGGKAPMAQNKAPAALAAPKVSKQSPAADYTPNVRFRLRTELAEGKMAFVGVGGDIEGVVNPMLRVAEGDVVQVGIINGDGVEHDLQFPDFKAATDRVNRKGASSVTVFRVEKAGEFAYFCSLPGHRQATPWPASSGAWPGS